MANFESARDWDGLEGRFGLLSDMSAQLALVDRFEKGSEFVWLTICLQLHSPVGKVPHPPGDVEAFRDLFNGIAKADALHVTFVEDSFRSHGRPENSGASF